MNQFKHISPPPPPPIQQSIDGQPLSPANYEQLEYASRQSKKIRNAAGVAAFNGYTFAIFAAISAMAAAFSLTTGEFDFIGIIITLGLGAIAHNELKGRRMLLNFDRRAPKR
ncbi:MAG TPA: hypothetical protein PKK48_06820, partial [Phycisphaerae bacterium]|nr:hypothetical protein [Phycisphaerae bacterium]